MTYRHLAWVTVAAVFVGALGCRPAPRPREAPREDLPCKPAPPLPKPAVKADPAKIAVGLDPHLARMVMSDRTDLSARATPYLIRGTIWDLEHFGHHPTYAHIGALDGEPSRALESSKAFTELARAAGLSLATDAARRAYVMTYLQFDPRVITLLESPDDLRYTVTRSIAEMRLDPESLELLGPLLEEDIAMRRKVEDGVAKAISPLCLAGGGPYRGVIHGIVRQRVLVRWEVSLSPGGEVSAVETVVAERVPVTIVVP